MGLWERFFSSIVGKERPKLEVGTGITDGNITFENKKEDFQKGIKYETKNNNAASTFIAYKPQYLQDMKFEINIFKLADDGRIHVGVDRRQGDSGEEKYLIVLKYDTPEKNEQVALATVTPKNHMFEEVKHVETNLKKQLLCNLQEELDRNIYERQLESYTREHNIDVDITEEGKKILTQTEPNIGIYKRTKFFREHDGGLYIEENNEQPVTNARNIEDKIKLQRYMILRNMTEEQKAMFLKGEEIVIRKRLFNEATTYEDIMRLEIDENEIIDELRNDHKLLLKQKAEKESEKDTKTVMGRMVEIPPKETRGTGTTPYEEYLQLKERGLSIDVKKRLEEKREELLNNNDEEGYKRLGTLSDYIDKIKYGQDHKARILKQVLKIDVLEMKNILIESSVKDEELIKYIELREKYDQVLNMKSGATVEEMEQKSDIKEFYNFLENVPFRNQTEKSKESLAMIYAPIVTSMTDMDIVYNIDAVNFYNNSVEKLGVDLAYVYPTSEELTKIIKKIQQDRIDSKEQKDLNKLEELGEEK